MKRQHPDASFVKDKDNVVQRESADVLQNLTSKNFEELARRYPAFCEAWKQTRENQQGQKAASFSACITQNFSISLTRALLHAYFDLNLPHLNENHLCPPVPNRFFYLHWIHTTLLPMRTTMVGRTSCSSSGNQTTPTASITTVRGLDIGSGASCIYGLLATRFFGWHMTTTEVDSSALELARRNVHANRLTNHISVLPVEPSQSQGSRDDSGGGPLQRSIRVACENTTDTSGQQQQRVIPHFVMTNPPFYHVGSGEHETVRAGDRRVRTNMTVSEGTYPGGEVGFVTEMIADSLLLQQLPAAHNESVSQCWFTTMICKKQSLLQLKKLLTVVLGPGHIQETEYGPGQYTRWFLAWRLARPVIRSPSARLSPHTSNYDSFEVSAETLTAITTQQDAIAEVLSRITAFCESSPGGWNVSVREIRRRSVPKPVCHLAIMETTVPPMMSFVDEREVTSAGKMVVPPLIHEALQKSPWKGCFLPREGHFLVDATIEVESRTSVRVHLACYRHSTRGMKAIEKIRSTIGAEIGRSNRKWRRFYKRQQVTVDQSMS